MNIVVIAGGNRKASTSTQLARYLQKKMTQEGHETLLIDLYQSPVPFFSPDTSYEENHPGLQHLKQSLLQADAVVLATPEYHSGISGVLKNALDHLGQSHFEGKAVLSVSSAAGAIAVSSLTQLQTIMRNLHGVNCPEWISIGGDQRKGFALENSEPEVHPELEKRMERATAAFLDLAARLSGKK